MAPRHATSPARRGACRPVAFGRVGGSGLIVVVIVAAWALFLVPQWMHRRASAAAHLADRIPDSEAGGDPVPDGHGTESATARTPRRFGRRHLVRVTSPEDGGRSWLSRLRLPSVPRLGRRQDDGGAAPVSAAARRRRVLIVLAISTLLGAVVVGVGALAGLAIPAWVVAVPGGLMVAYLALLAIVRPGAPRSEAAGPALRPDADDVVTLAPVTSPQHDAAALEPGGTGESAGSVGSVESLESGESVADPAGDTWTPVPLPTPTYVTAPRARRSIRTIDLSNPGSWTASAPSAPEPAAVGAGETGELEEYPIEHRRAVGD